jgi:hypothetical protein
LHNITLKNDSTTYPYHSILSGVFGDTNMATEPGKTTRNHASGEVIYAGKYIAVWKKCADTYQPEFLPLGIPICTTWKTPFF